MARYKKPKKLNLVSFLVLVGLAAAAYSVVQFGPPYWRQYKVKGVLQDVAVRYSKWGDAVAAKTRDQATVRIRNVGVEDPGLQIFFRRSGGMVDVWATYVEVVKHPLVNKITTLRFSPLVTVPDYRKSGNHF